MIFRMRFRLLGGHVHIRLFAGRGEGSLAKCGDLVMRPDEFEAFKAAAYFIKFKEDRDAAEG